MRIAQVAPLSESVPPKRYGGTERVVSYLCEELVRQGHDVTLFASGDSKTSAHLVACCAESLRQKSDGFDQLAQHVVMIEQVFRMAQRFDIIHFHIDYLHFPMSCWQSTPQVTTLHGRLDIPDPELLYGEFPEMPLVSISDAQRAPLPRGNWQGTVHHGLPPDIYTFRPAHAGYLAFLGRISREKRVDRAIWIARAVGLPIKVAAKIDRQDRAYYEQDVKPLFSLPGVDYVGEIGEREKDDFLGGAAALLFPIDWPEPFGLVMIEAMACGTPVIAWRGGSVEEVMEDGVSGFVVDNLGEAVRAVERVSSLDRRGVRAVFDRRFTADRMTREYLRIYWRLLKGHTPDQIEGARRKARLSSDAA